MDECDRLDAEAGITTTLLIYANAFGVFDDYLNFLSSGGSRFPLDSLSAAGVDMRSPEPVEKALAYFGELVSELESY